VDHQYDADRNFTVLLYNHGTVAATSATYHYGFRIYDPVLQRWLNRDPIFESVGIITQSQGFFRRRRILFPREKSRLGCRTCEFCRASSHPALCISGITSG